MYSSFIDERYIFHLFVHAVVKITTECISNLDGVFQKYHKTASLPIRLLRIVDSEHFLSSLTDDIKSRATLSSKYLKNIQSSKQELEENSKAKVKFSKEMKELHGECFRRKKMLEEMISEKYDNRPVNIMGPFNNLVVR